MTDQDPTQRYQPPPADQALPTLPVPPAMPPAAPPPPPGGVPATPPAPPEAVAATPTVPVEATPRARQGGRLRWIVAGIVTLLVAGTAAGATWMLTRDSGSPVVMDWAPADSVMYAELRLDLPGDQQAELASVMSAFPGFDDQAAFDLKLGEALDQLVGRATDGKHDYQTWIEPWFGGQLSMSTGPLPESIGGAKDARALLLASVTDADKASAWAASLLAESGATTATESYNGVTITTVTPPEDHGGGMTAAYAIPGPVLAMGDVASVKAAIDTNGSGELTTSEPFRDALASVTGDRLGFAYVNTAAILEATAALGGADMEVFAMELPSFLADRGAPWVAMALRADDDAFVVDTRQPHVDGGVPPTATESEIAAVAPESTVFLVAFNEVEAGITELRRIAAEDPSLGDGVKEIEDALAIVGGLDAIVGWMEDVGVAVTREGDAVAGGLLITPTEPDGAAAAERLLTQLRGFLALAGASSGITVSSEAYGGTTITTITIANVGDLAGLATGGVVDGPDVPETIELAYAATDEVVVLGYTGDFVKAVLDARTGESLAGTERFSSLLARADKAHASLAWIDVAGVRGLVEGMIPSGERAEYDADARPYLEAFDALIATSAPGEDLDEGTIIIRVTGQ